MFRSNQWLFWRGLPRGEQDLGSDESAWSTHRVMLDKPTEMVFANCQFPSVAVWAVEAGQGKHGETVSESIESKKFVDPAAGLCSFNISHGQQ